MEKIMLNDTGEWVEVPQIIAVDYDGTIDFAGFPNVGKIDEIALNALKAWKAKGNKLILWTCRSGDHLSLAINCCKDNGLEFDAVNENVDEIKKAGFESPKVFANYYIDDRAMGNHGLTVIWQFVSNGKIQDFFDKLNSEFQFEVDVCAIPENANSFETADAFTHDLEQAFNAGVKLATEELKNCQNCANSNNGEECSDWVSCENYEHWEKN